MLLLEAAQKQISEELDELFKLSGGVPLEEFAEQRSEDDKPLNFVQRLLQEDDPLKEIHERFEHGKESLLNRYANLVPSALDGLDAAQRRQVYGMLRVEAAIGQDGALEVCGDVISISTMEILSV
jgi:hypothetical protein